LSLLLFESKEGERRLSNAKEKSYRSACSSPDLNSSISVAIKVTRLSATAACSRESSVAR